MSIRVTRTVTRRVPGRQIELTPATGVLASIIQRRWNVTSVGVWNWRGKSLYLSTRRVDGGGVDRAAILDSAHGLGEAAVSRARTGAVAAGNRPC